MLFLMNAIFPGNSTATINLFDIPTPAVPEQRHVVLHQGGDEEGDEPPHHILPYAPAPPPQQVAIHPPAPPAPEPDMHPDPQPEPQRRNPPRSSRFTGSLNENQLSCRQPTVPPAPQSPSPEPVSVPP